MKNNRIVVNARNLTKHFPIKMGFFKSLLSEQTLAVHAVDSANFKIREEEIFGLIGESGCGKTTTGKLLIKLLEPTDGNILFRGKDITLLSEKETQKLRSKMQIIFQDPYESLNPRMSIYDIVSEPLHLQETASSEEEIVDKAHDIMEEMGLTPAEQFLYRYPHELSGGQRQRVAVARAFIIRPTFVVADEPVSMLDASIRTEVLKLIRSLTERFHVSYLYITHDIALARYMCDRIAIMYLGKIVEKGETEEVIKNPLHPYTEALLAAVPVPDPKARRSEIVIKGQVPSAVNPPPGCRFHTRCPYAKEICREKEPEMTEVRNNRYVACHFPLQN